MSKRKELTSSWYILPAVLVIYTATIVAYFFLETSLRKSTCSTTVEWTTERVIGVCLPGAALTAGCLITFDRLISRLAICTILAFLCYTIGDWLISGDDKHSNFRTAMLVYGVGHLMAIASFASPLFWRSRMFWLLSTSVIGGTMTLVAFMIANYEPDHSRQAYMSGYAATLASVMWWSGAEWASTLVVAGQSRQQIYRCSARTRFVGYANFVVNDCIAFASSSIEPVGGIACGHEFKMLVYFTALLCIFVANAMKSIEMAVDERISKKPL